MQLLKSLMSKDYENALTHATLTNKIIERVASQFVHRRVKSPPTVDTGNLFHERELAAFDVQRKDIDLDAGLGAAKDFGHRLFQGLADRWPGEEGLAVVRQVGRRFAVGHHHDLTLAAFVAHEVTAQGQRVLEI